MPTHVRSTALTKLTFTVHWEPGEAMLLEGMTLFQSRCVQPDPLIPHKSKRSKPISILRKAIGPCHSISWFSRSAGASDAGRGEKADPDESLCRRALN